MVFKDAFDSELGWDRVAVALIGGGSLNELIRVAMGGSGRLADEEDGR